MAYEEPDLPVSGNAVSTSGFGFKVRNSIIWLKEQIDALLAGTVIYRRTGGSATDWDNLFGTTVYSPTKSKMQLVHGAIEFSDNLDKTATVDITFPVAFDDKPFVLPKIELSLDAGMTVEAWATSGSACKVQVRKYVGSSSLSFDVSVLAIGDIS